MEPANILEPLQGPLKMCPKAMGVAHAPEPEALLLVATHDPFEVRPPPARRSNSNNRIPEQYISKRKHGPSHSPGFWRTNDQDTAFARLSIGNHPLIQKSSAVKKHLYMTLQETELQQRLGRNWLMRPAGSALSGTMVAPMAIW